MISIKYTHILAYSPQANNTYVYHYISNDVADLYETKIRLKKEPQIKYSEFVSDSTAIPDNMVSDDKVYKYMNNLEDFIKLYNEQQNELNKNLVL